MRTHDLKNAESIVLHYTVISQPQSGNFDQPSFEAGIEINDITILGRQVSKAKFSELLNKNECVWVGEILDALKTDR